MARKGRVDRGLRGRKNAAGKMIWYVRIGIGGGKEIERGPFMNKTAAREFYQKCKTEQAEDRFNPDRSRSRGHEAVHNVLDRYLRTATLKKDLRSEQYFAEWWGERLGKQRARDVTPEMLEEVRLSLLAKGLTPQRVNRYLQWLRKVFNVEVRYRRLSTNPVLTLKMFKEPKGRTRFLTIEEEHKLMAALRTPYALWARLAILTGLRQEEQFSLTWSNVDLDRGLITLPSTKSSEVQYVHLNDEAKAILRSFDSWQWSRWVFPAKNPSSHMDARNFYGRVWMPAVKRAGIDWVTWHELRHTFASRLAMSGATEGTIASLLRHSSTALVKRYAHLSPSHLKAAVEELATFGKAEMPANRGGIGMNAETEKAGVA